MKKNKGRLSLTTIVLILMIHLLSSPAWAGSVNVITGASTPTSAIDEAEIQKIFLGKTKTWPDGSPVEFVVLESGDVHDNFLKLYVKKNPDQFNTYWKKQVFTGKGKSPKTFGSEAELAAYVAGKTGTIGYVSASAELAGAKVINEK